MKLGRLNHIGVATAKSSPARGGAPQGRRGPASRQALRGRLGGTPPSRLRRATSPFRGGFALRQPISNIIMTL